MKKTKLCKCGKEIGYYYVKQCKSCANKKRKGTKNKGGWKHTKTHKDYMSKIMTGVKKSVEHRKKMSEVRIGFKLGYDTKAKGRPRLNRRGNKHSNWKGGTTKNSMIRLNRIEWRKIALKIRKFYKFICQECGKGNTKDVHHIIPWRISKDNSVKNLILLCRSCHFIAERAFNKK